MVGSLSIMESWDDARLDKSAEKIPGMCGRKQGRVGYIGSLLHSSQISFNSDVVVRKLQGGAAQDFCKLSYT